MIEEVKAKKADEKAKINKKSRYQAEYNPIPAVIICGVRPF